MTPVSFVDFLRALALKVVLDRLGASAPAPARPRALEPPAPRTLERRPGRGLPGRSPRWRS
jgi:hypothetical protein